MAMKALWILPLALLVGLTPASAEENAPGGEAVLPAETPRNVRLEQELQALSWPQFRAVVQAVPKLKAEVDAYGSFGWQYVQARYQTFRWRKSIAKLKPEQQEELGVLIAQARAGRLPPPRDGNRDS